MLQSLNLLFHASLRIQILVLILPQQKLNIRVNKCSDNIRAPLKHHHLSPWCFLALTSGGIYRLAAFANQILYHGLLRKSFSLNEGTVSKICLWLREHFPLDPEQVCQNEGVENISVTSSNYQRFSLDSNIREIFVLDRQIKGRQHQSLKNFKKHKINSL